MANHYKDPISQDPNHIGGNSRKAGYAGLGAKTAVIFGIRDQAEQYGLSERDVANLLAIAKLESGKIWKIRGQSHFLRTNSFTD